MPFFTVEKAPYTPPVSSPLNPESCYEIPPKKVRRCRAIQLNGRRIPNSISPTQRLLRQKAEAAWRSQKGHIRPRHSADNDSLDITMIYHGTDAEGHRRDEHNLRVRIDIDRATVVTVIPMQGGGKPFHQATRSGFHDDQEGLVRTQRRTTAFTARKILLIIALLFAVGLILILRVGTVLIRPLATS